MIPVLIPLLLALGDGVQAPAAPDGLCDPMPGLEDIVPLARTDYLIVGETHGTVELPAAFSAIACASLKDGRPVLVGVEHPAAMQTALDANLASDGGEEARDALTATPAWETDPRFSAAMLALIEDVRRWRAAGRDVTLVAFDAPIDQPGTSAAREAGMAHHLIAARQDRGAGLVVALTGLGHADRRGFSSMSPPVDSMIKHLPADRTSGLAFVRSGGESWRCVQDPDARRCGAMPLSAPEALVERGVTVSYDPGRLQGPIFTRRAPDRLTACPGPLASAFRKPDRSLRRPPGACRASRLGLDVSSQSGPAARVRPFSRRRSL
ncbi:hypothetical protein ACIQC9_07030 [Brevundimonas sp. NPDC092305]|uniref:hypothetical protein n=1 Tax=Brevundimonas sp. NPDC092305 TaxID=3363957 RepID=UPI0037F8AD7D